MINLELQSVEFKSRPVTNFILPLSKPQLVTEAVKGNITLNGTYLGNFIRNPENETIAIFSQEPVKELDKLVAGTSYAKLVTLCEGVLPYESIRVAHTFETFILELINTIEFEREHGGDFAKAWFESLGA